MKTFASSLALLLVAAMIGGWIWWREREPLAPPDHEILWRLNVDEVDSLQLSGGGKPVVLRLEENDVWRVGIENRSVPADSAQVREFLKQIEVLQTPVSFPLQQNKLHEYGIDRPASTLRVGNRTIEFGARPPFDSSRIYARVDGKIVLLPLALAQIAAQPAQSWRDFSVLRFDASRASRLQITAPALRATLTREKVDDATQIRWRLIEPLRTSADAAAVQSFLGVVSQAKTPRFLEENPASLSRWELQNPRATLVLQLKGDGQNDNKPREISLLVGKKMEAGYAARSSQSPAIFVLPETVFHLLNRPLREWRDKNLARFDINQLEKVEIAARGRRLEFIQRDGRWISQRGAQLDSQASQQAALELLSQLQEITAQRFIESAIPSNFQSFARPALEVIWTTKSETVTLQFRVTKDNVQARRAAPHETPVVAELSANDWALLRPAIDLLFPPK